MVYGRCVLWYIRVRQLIAQGKSASQCAGGLRSRRSGFATRHIRHTRWEGKSALQAINCSFSTRSCSGTLSTMLGSAHMGCLLSTLHNKSPQFSKSRPELNPRRGSSLNLSTSHPDAVKCGCTNIPHTAGQAQDDETILAKRRLAMRTLDSSAWICQN